MMQNSTAPALAPGVVFAAMSMFTAVLPGCVGTGTGTRVVAAGQTASLDTAGFAGPAEAAVATEQYYPLDRFFSWTYGVTIVAGASTTSAQDIVRVEEYSKSSKTGTLSFTRREGGQTIRAASGSIAVTSTAATLTQDGLVELIKLPLKAGETWKSGSLTASSFAVPSLTVGATTYEKVIAVSFARDAEVVVVRYFAPNVGVVRTLTRQKEVSKTYLITHDLADSRTVAISGVAFTPATALTLAKGETAELAVSGTRADGSTTRELTLLSDNTAVATIAKGSETTAGFKAVIAAVAAGTASIKVVSDQDPTKLATVSVTVN